MRLTPAAASSGCGEGLAAHAHHEIHRLRERRAHGAHRGEVRQPRREQHVGAGALEGLQAPHRIVKIGAAVQEILGARGEGERERTGGVPPAPRRPRARPPARTRRWARPARRSHPRSRRRRARRRPPGGWSRRTPPGHAPKPFSRSAATGSALTEAMRRAWARASSRVRPPSCLPKRRRRRRARGRQGRKPQLRHDRRGTAVPDIRNDEGSGGLVQRAKLERLVVLAGHAMGPSQAVRPDDCVTITPPAATP